MKFNLRARLTSEFIGSGFLVAAVIGSGIMGERLAGGNVAIALLANTVATGAALVALILTFGPISGAHLNPAVTLADAMEHGIPWREAVAYILVQAFNLPGEAASDLYWRGINKIYGKKPDDAGAEKAFRRSVELDPTAYFVHIELGNLYLKRGSREACVRAYSEALRYAPEDPKVRSALQSQIQLVSRGVLAGVSPLRDPHME
jgi:tetratricopeptide (TPR) repeat protein